MKRLSDFQSFLEIAPTSLINSQQSSSFVFRIIGNHYADEKGQSNHTSQENVDVNVNSVNLKKANFSNVSSSFFFFLD